MPDAPAPFDPTRIYAHVVDGRAELVEGGAAFWQHVDARFERGQLVCAFDIERDTGWEVHPAGDELLVMLTGAVDVELELPDGVRTVALRAPHAFYVPRGIWHRALVREPGRMLFVTPGEGTRHRDGPTSP
jgi:mannose-6-phosphate isomerase-like protein (cupin superfamily)